MANSVGKSKTNLPTLHTVEAPKTGSATRRSLVALATAAALTGLAPQVASAETPVSSSVSASASADKGLGYGQMAQNGDKFDEFLQKHGNGAIDEAGMMVDSGKWTEKDYDAFVKYQDAQDVKANLLKKNE